MAAAGFFAIGKNEEPDLVECFICSKQLDGWDPDDDPWYVSLSANLFYVLKVLQEHMYTDTYTYMCKITSTEFIYFRQEHKKHNAQCPFVKLNKPNETAWTVQDLFDLFKKYEVKECVSIMYEHILKSLC